MSAEIPLSDSELEDALPDRPVTTVQDIQYLYGLLSDLAAGYTTDYESFLTPSESAGFRNSEEQSLIVVRVDVSGDAPSFEGVDVQQYTDDHIPLVAHARSSANRGVDHSITHQSGEDSSPEKLARYAKNRLSRWALDDIIQDFVETELSEEEGSVIRDLQTLGESDEVLEEIREEVLEKVGGDRTALLTVRVKRDVEGDWLWPGEIDVLNKALMHHRLDKFASKNNKSSEGKSRGKGVDQVTGDEMLLVGTAGDPLNFYKSKQRGSYSGLSLEDAWLTRQIAGKSILQIQNATPYVESMFTNAYGLRVYMLPYYTGGHTADKARTLYRVIEHIQEGGEDALVLPTMYDDGLLDVEEPFEFYTLFVKYQQDTRFDVLGEVEGNTNLPLVDVADEHQSVLASSLIGARDSNAPYSEAEEDWQNVLTNTTLSAQDWIRKVASGEYINASLRRDENEGASDPRVFVFRQLLKGEAIDRQTLLRKYVQCINDTEGADTPQSLIVGQYAQMQALLRNGLVTGESWCKGLTGSVDLDYMDEKHMKTDDISRTEKIDAYLEASPDLSEDSGRRGAFLVGVVIGRVSMYQTGTKGEDLSRSVRDEYPIDRMTKRKLKNATTTVIDRVNVYSSREDMPLMYADLVSRMRDALTQHPVDDWEITDADLQFYYGLGLTYGLNDRTTNTETNN